MTESMDVFGLKMVLVCGPHEGDGDWTTGQLRRGWTMFGRGLVAHMQQYQRPGLRPWAFWTLDHRLEEDPGWVDGIRLLARWGLLSAGERERLAERAMDAAEARARGDRFSQEDLDAAAALTSASG